MIIGFLFAVATKDVLTMLTAAGMATCFGVDIARESASETNGFPAVVDQTSILRSTSIQYLNRVMDLCSPEE